MPQTREKMTQHPAERLWWEGARLDEARVARRRSHQPVVDGVYRLDAAAVLDELFPFLRELGVMTWLEDVLGVASHRVLVPFVPGSFSFLVGYQ